MLHTISRSFSAIDTDTILTLLSSDDVVVLIQDGVVNGLTSSRYWSRLITAKSHYYALEADVTARGLEKHLAPEIQLIDIEEFINLTVNHFPQLAW